MSVGLPQCGGGRAVHSGWSCKESLLWLCRRTALHYASRNGHTATAMALVKAGADVHGKDSAGYDSRGGIVVSSACHSVGADGPSTRGGAAGVPALAVQADCAALCVAERPHGDGVGAGQGGGGRALQDQRRVRFSPRAASLCRRVDAVSGRTVRPLGVERQECPKWLCRMTALHDASLEGHTETAMALVKAGADVHCQDSEGYGSRGCILVSVGLPQCRGGRSVLSAWRCTSACLGCAG